MAKLKEILRFSDISSLKRLTYMQKSSDWGNVVTKKLNRVGNIQYTCALRDPYPAMKRGGEGKVVSATGCSLF